MTWLKQCLDSCEGQQIIVVDNASSDGTLQFISENYPEIIVLPQKKNLGFGVANNIGISHALKNYSADYVYLLNQDAYLVGNVIQNLINIHTQNTEYGILSPIHLSGNKNELDLKFKEYVFQHNDTLTEEQLLADGINEIYDVPFINAAGWLMTKECLLDVGGFDPMFFLYGEDDNLCQRVLYHGYNIGVVSGCYMIHDRALRKHEKLNINSDKFKEVQANIYKVKYANINDDNAEYKLYDTLSYLKRQSFKNTLLIRFSALRESSLKYRLLKNNVEKIKSSYQLNKTKAAHYLYL